MSEPTPGSESLSIGEMLDLLKAEFPDVTISKIRFLESQGLLDPERTASGYRKFYQADVERLRWILRQQRENFLPLKVIKGRLEAEGDGVIDEPADGSGPTPEPAGEPAPAAGDPAATAPPARSAPPASVPPAQSAEPTPSIGPSAREDRPGGAAGGAAGGAPGRTVDDATAGADAPSVTFTRDELARASELHPADLVQLERHGLLVGGSVGGQLYYDGEALAVAKIAAAFARHGVEARHLRMYKNSAEREAGLYEQVVLPLMKQRNPTAQRQAAATLAELAQLGEDLREALLRKALSASSAEAKAPRRRG